MPFCKCRPRCSCCKCGSSFPVFLRWCPGSPFHVGIQDEVNPNKVRCYGAGIDTKEVTAGKPATFTVDTTSAGQAPLDVTYTDDKGKSCT